MKGIQIVTIATMLLLTIGLISTSGNLNTEKNIGVGSSLGLTGYACMEIDRTDGSHSKQCGYNTFVEVGTNATWERIFFGAFNQFDYLALGNGTAPISTSTSLNNEIADCGLTRAQGTPAWIDQANVSVTYKWTSSCDNVDVNTTALFNNSAGGTMLAGLDFGTETLNTDDNMTIDYYTWGVIG